MSLNSYLIPAEAHSTRMFQGFPEELLKAVTQEPLTGNFHHYGLAVKVFLLCFISSFGVLNRHWTEK